MGSPVENPAHVVLRRCNQRQYEVICRLEEAVALASRALFERDLEARTAFREALGRLPVAALTNQPPIGVGLTSTKLSAGQAE